MNMHELGNTLTPTSLVSEVQEFRAAVANPACSADEIRRAYGLIVDHAGHLNPHAPGFECAGGLPDPAQALNRSRGLGHSKASHLELCQWHRIRRSILRQ